MLATKAAATLVSQAANELRPAGKLTRKVIVAALAGHVDDQDRGKHRRQSSRGHCPRWGRANSQTSLSHNTLGGVPGTFHAAARAMAAAE